MRGVLKVAFHGFAGTVARRALRRATLFFFCCNSFPDRETLLLPHNWVDLLLTYLLRDGTVHLQRASCEGQVSCLVESPINMATLDLRLSIADLTRSVTAAKVVYLAAFDEEEHVR